MKIAKGTLSWIVGSFLLALLSLSFFVFSNIKNSPLSIVFLIITILLFLLTIFFVMFFRDPDRKIGQGIVAVADGKIRDITKFEDKDIGFCICISTFMNVNNVHVNRMPLNGKVESMQHIDGGHIPAFKKESDRNERVITIIDSKIGKIKVVQIAGTLARRIVPYIRRIETLKKGEKIGIIRLGSRVDVYLPSKKIKKVCVKVGDKIKAGEDCLAEIYG